jgi:general secretion pathway protein N
MLAAVGLLAYLAALAASAPASWIGRAIERASAERLALRDPAGTAWSGAGRLFARSRGGHLLELGGVSWTLAPAALLGGTISADVRLGGSASPAHLELSRGSAAVQKLDVELPGAILAMAVAGLEALDPGGRVRIRSDSLRLEPRSLLGMAEIEWRQVRLAPARGLDLGSHVARLRGGGSRVDVELATLDGPLKLAGRGTWTRDAGLDFSGTAEPASGRDGALASFLKGMCSEYRDGRCDFRITR